VGDLDPPPAGQVAIEVELLLQLQGLVPGVRLPSALAFCWFQVNKTIFTIKINATLDRPPNQQQILLYLQVHYNAYNNKSWMKNIYKYICIFDVLYLFVLFLPDNRMRTEGSGLGELKTT